MEYYDTIEDLLDIIVCENTKQGCLKILSENRKLFEMTQGSANNHQAWVGGYLDHVQEVMNIGQLLHFRLSCIRQLPFNVDDVIIVLFLHDIEKPWKYELREDGKSYYLPEFETKEQALAFREKKLKEYGIILTPEQQNAMKYVEGEFDDHSNRERKMNPLAALCHCADTISARIWFDHPKENEDRWIGASRIRKF